MQFQGGCARSGWLNESTWSQSCLKMRNRGPMRAGARGLLRGPRRVLEQSLHVLRV